MNKRFHIVAKAKLKKKAQADREAKKRKRPRLPWAKAKDSAGTSLGAITEATFKDYLINEARYAGTIVKKPVRVSTETGWAKLFPDGSMKLNNSGYKQELTPEQVETVWNGASEFEIEDPWDDGEPMIVMKDDWYGLWDFGDESHEIPEPHQFGIGKKPKPKPRPKLAKIRARRGPRR